MDEVDFKKKLGKLYDESAKEPSILNVPQMSYLMIDGEGDPNNSKDYVDAVQSLYSVAYTMKFAIKKEGKIKYAVMPLEGLWWVDDMSKFSQEDKRNWKWTAMIMQPEVVTKEVFDKCLEDARKRKGFPGILKIRFAKYDEGLSVQIMYVGPYSGEGQTIKRLHEFAKKDRYRLRGRHHEIYLGDPRRTKPEKLKTIIRQPVSAL